MKKLFTLFVCISLLSTSCATLKTLPNSGEINTLRFIDELIIPENLEVAETVVGGLSSIEYRNGKWYALCDNRNNPRFYELDLEVSLAGFGDYEVVKAVVLKDAENTIFTKGVADPESMRVTATNEVVWSSEGNISKGIPPFVRKATLNGNFIEEYTLPKKYLIQKNTDVGPVNNGVFEALSLGHHSSYFWLTTELPLKEDGDVPTNKEANSPVRLSKLNYKNSTTLAEYAYPLDKVAREGSLEVNGVTELLAYGASSLLVLERSYASGYDDGGNDVKIYKIDVSAATDVSTLQSLKEENYTAVKKELLLDLGDIRSLVPSGIIDNIEGITFGPRLSNGKRSLVLISDNNFNSFGKQITQLLLFEVL